MFSELSPLVDLMSILHAHLTDASLFPNELIKPQL